jgi:hypothetical protein
MIKQINEVVVLYLLELFTRAANKVLNTKCWWYPCMNDDSLKEFP